MKICKLLSFGVNALIIAICAPFSSCTHELLESPEDINDNLVHCVFTAGVPSDSSYPTTRVALEGDAASQPIIVKWKGSSSNFRDSFALIEHDEDGGISRYTASRLSNETEDDVSGTFETTAPENENLYLVYPNRKEDGNFTSGNDWDKDNWVFSIEKQTGLFDELSNYIFMAGENTVKITDGEMIGDIRFKYETAILRVSNLRIPELAGQTVSNLSLKSNAICSSIAYRYGFNPYYDSRHEVSISNAFQVDNDGMLSDNVYFVFFPSGEPIDFLYLKAEVNGKTYSYKYDGTLNSFSAGKVYTLNNKTLVGLESADYSWYTDPISSGVYELSTAADLLGFANLCNGTADALSAVNADAAVSFSGEIVRIKNGLAGIDLSSVCNGGQSWIPIKNFKGTFEGNGVPVTSLFINETLATSQDVGFFSNLVDATIQNLNISGRITTNGGHNVCIGGITGFARSSSIFNCQSGVDISHTTGGETRVGGICGYHGGCYFIGCSSTSTISTSYKNQAAQYIGGIGGFASVTKSYYIGCSHTSGEISCSQSGYENYSTSGGILGVSSDQYTTKIVACYNSAKITMQYPGAILGSCGVRYGASRTPDITSSYYTANAGCLGVGVAYYQGYTCYDYGTAKITDPAAAIEDMNAAIIAWNTENVEYLCNMHYVVVNDEICLVDGAPANE